MLIWFTLWIVTGCVISFAFFRFIDSMLKDHPDENGCRSFNEVVNHSIHKNSTKAHISFIVKFVIAAGTIIIWPFFAILLIWIKWH